jgi:enediyne biosynthesis protein E4
MSCRTLSVLMLAALGGASAQNYPVLLNDAAVPISVDGMDTRSISAGDFDGDGDVDLFAANFAQPSLAYRNDGFGNFEIVPPFSLNSGASHSFDAAWGDMDGDGDLDLAVANGSKNLQPDGQGLPEDLYENLGPLPFTEGRFKKKLTGPIGVDKGETYGVEWIDLESDGDLDLVFVNRLQTNFMYLNDGAGNFTKVTTGPFVTDVGTARDVAVGDLDNDGDTDIVVARSEGGTNAIYLNQGGAQAGTEGSFVRLTGDPAADDVGQTYGVSLADYDDDGDLDLFASRRFSEGNMLYRNDGSAHFQKMTGLAPSEGASDSYRSSWGDLDRDGDLDLIVANRNASNFYYINEGDGTFTQILYGQLPDMVGDARDVTIADLDGDMFPEVMFANTLGGNDYFFRNRGRTWKDMGFEYYPSVAQPRLTGEGTLAPGSISTYAVQTGPSTTAGFMVAGFTTIFAPFKGGTLVPAPDIVVPGFATDSSGELGFSSTFPAGVPAGLSLFHQMWFVDGSSPTGFTSSNGLSALTP